MKVLLRKKLKSSTEKSFWYSFLFLSFFLFLFLFIMIIILSISTIYLFSFSLVVSVSVCLCVCYCIIYYRVVQINNRAATAATATEATANRLLIVRICRFVFFLSVCLSVCKCVWLNLNKKRWKQKYKKEALLGAHVGKRKVAVVRSSEQKWGSKFCQHNQKKNSNVTSRAKKAQYCTRFLLVFFFCFVVVCTAEKRHIIFVCSFDWE